MLTTVLYVFFYLAFVVPGIARQHYSYVRSLPKRAGEDVPHMAEIESSQKIICDVQWFE